MRKIRSVLAGIVGLVAALMACEASAEGHVVSGGMLLESCANEPQSCEGYIAGIMDAAIELTGGAPWKVGVCVDGPVNHADVRRLVIINMGGRRELLSQHASKAVIAALRASYPCK